MENRKSNLRVTQKSAFQVAYQVKTFVNPPVTAH